MIAKVVRAIAKMISFQNQNFSVFIIHCLVLVQKRSKKIGGYFSSYSCADWMIDDTQYIRTWLCVQNFILKNVHIALTIFIKIMPTTKLLAGKVQVPSILKAVWSLQEHECIRAKLMQVWFAAQGLLLQYTKIQTIEKLFELQVSRSANYSFTPSWPSLFHDLWRQSSVSPLPILFHKLASNMSLNLPDCLP